MSERESLFRPQVLQARLPGSFGPAFSAAPVSLRVYTAACLIMLSVLLLYMGFARFKTTVSVPGVLVPAVGVISVTANWQGDYERILVSEGDRLEAGDVLALVSTDRRDSAGDRRSDADARHLQQRIQGLRRTMRLEEEAVSMRRRHLEEERGQVARELALVGQEEELMNRRLTLSSRSLDAYSRLKDRGVIADIELQRHQAAHLTLAQEHQRLLLRRAGLAGELRRLDDGMRTAELEHGLRQHELNEAVGQLLHEQRSLRDDALLAVTAPADGIAGPVTLSAGDPSIPGRLLLTILPVETTLEAVVYLPGQAVGRVRAGQDVLITYEAYPYQTHGNHRSRVLGVSRTTLDPRAQRLPIAELREPVYRLRAALPEQVLESDGEIHELRAGMRLKAEIVTAEMSLLSYMFDPLLRLLRKHEVAA